jgi:hypothetical protein
MAKRRVGVLESYEAPNSCEPKTFCGRAIAERMIATREARRLGGRLIQMVRAKACEAIKQAKAARDAVEKTIERMIFFYDGPMGRGNILPFAKPRSSGDKLHYSTPMAGDVGMRRYGLYSRLDEHGVRQLCSKLIRSSKRMPDEVVIAQLSASYNWRLKVRQAIA